LWKYKTQTIISIIGLAVGFTCFSLATDNFHKNAKNLYVATMPYSFTFNNAGKTLDFRNAVPTVLKEIFPEVKEATSIVDFHTSYTIGEQTVDLDRIMTTSAFMTMFDIKVLEGSLDFTDDKKVAITEEKAKALFGTESFRKIIKDIAC